MKPIKNLIHHCTARLAERFPNNKFLNGERKAKRLARQAEFRRKFHIFLEKPAVRFMSKYSLFFHIILACALVLIIETCSRHSLLSAFSFAFTSPLAFLYNALLVFASLLLVYLFKRRMLFRIVISVFWVLLGVVNGIILASRVTPFNFTDLKLISDLLAMKNSKYVTVGESVLILCCLIAVVVFIIFIAVRGPKFHGKIHRVRNLLGLVACLAVIPFITKGAIHSDILSGYFGNLAQGYQDYGFVYSFSASVVDTGMKKPSNYSQSTVNQILQTESKKKTSVSSKDQPNIIFVQLESFIDPNELTFLKYSKDPTPNFHKLRSNYSSGYLTVPVVGAGTANTEFEVMTGMTLKYFGLGEYPFKTVLKSSTSESIATDLHSIGYGTHVLHNNGGNFYSRATVFRNLGFDSFTSKEEMNITKYNEINTWPADDILVSETKKTLDSTRNKPDYIYTITVQSHGSYPTEKVFTNPEIKVTGGDTTEKNNQWEYYINEIHEVDNFVGNLIQMLSKRDEKTLVVFYGDHLPTMGLEEKDVKSGNLFHTVYATWDNFGLAKKDKNVTTYQLSSYITNRLGIHEGTIFKYHQTSMSNGDDKKSNYLSRLQQLQYDLLYGGNYANGGKDMPASDLEMGVQNVTIRSLALKQSGSSSADTQQQASNTNEKSVNKAAEQAQKSEKKSASKSGQADSLTPKVATAPSGTDSAAGTSSAEEETEPVISIKGKNFTPWSKVYINGSAVSTTYVSGSELEISPDALSDGCKICIQQMGSGDTVFRRSNTITLAKTADLTSITNDPSTASGKYSDTSKDLTDAESSEAGNSAENKDTNHAADTDKN